MNYKLFGLLAFVVLLRYLTLDTPYEDGDRVRVTGRLSREVVTYDNSQQIEVEGLSSYVSKYPEVHYGDTVTVTGVVEGRQLKNVTLEKVEASHDLLYRIRRSIVTFYQSSLPEPHASLIAGISIGSKSGMPAQFWDKLRLSGTAHVVVASGMNVTLVGGFLLNALIKVVDRKKAIGGVLLGVWIYALLAGFDAPIVRAAIMGSIAFSAQALGRLNYALNVLFLSAFLMLFASPLWIEDIGFQLSFVATLSLILFESKVERLIYFVPYPFRQDLSTSFAAQIGVAPLLLYYFHSFNILSPLINGLVLWTIPLITIAGMSAAILGLFVPIAGRVVLILTFPLSTWFISVVSLVA